MFFHRVLSLLLCLAIVNTQMVYPGPGNSIKEPSFPNPPPPTSGFPSQVYPGPSGPGGSDVTSKGTSFPSSNILGSSNTFDMGSAFMNKFGGNGFGTGLNILPSSSQPSGSSFKNGNVDFDLFDQSKQSLVGGTPLLGFSTDAGGLPASSSKSNPGGFNMLSSPDSFPQPFQSPSPKGGNQGNPFDTGSSGFGKNANWNNAGSVVFDNNVGINNGKTGPGFGSSLGTSSSPMVFESPVIESFGPSGFGPFPEANNVFPQQPRHQMITSGSAGFPSQPFIQNINTGPSTGFTSQPQPLGTSFQQANKQPLTLDIPASNLNIFGGHTKNVLSQNVGVASSSFVNNEVFPSSPASFAPSVQPVFISNQQHAFRGPLGVQGDFTTLAAGTSGFPGSFQQNGVMQIAPMFSSGAQGQGLVGREFPLVTQPIEFPTFPTGPNFGNVNTNLASNNLNNFNSQGISHFNNFNNQGISHSNNFNSQGNNHFNNLNSQGNNNFNNLNNNFHKFDNNNNLNNFDNNNNFAVGSLGVNAGQGHSGLKMKKGPGLIMNREHQVKATDMGASSLPGQSQSGFKNSLPGPGQSNPNFGSSGHVHSPQCLFNGHLTQSGFGVGGSQAFYEAGKGGVLSLGGGGSESSSSSHSSGEGDR